MEPIFTAEFVPFFIPREIQSFPRTLSSSFFLRKKSTDNFGDLLVADALSTGDTISFWSRLSYDTIPNV